MRRAGNGRVSAASDQGMNRNLDFRGGEPYPCPVPRAWRRRFAPWLLLLLLPAVAESEQGEGAKDRAHERLVGVLREAERSESLRRRLDAAAQRSARGARPGPDPLKLEVDSQQAALLLDAYRVLLQSQEGDLAGDTLRQAGSEFLARRYLAAWDRFTFFVYLARGTPRMADPARKRLESAIPASMNAKIELKPRRLRAPVRAGWKAFREGRWEDALKAWAEYRRLAGATRAEQADLRELARLEPALEARAALISEAALQGRIKEALKAVERSPSKGVRQVLEPLLYQSDRLKPEAVETVRAGLLWAHAQERLENSFEEARASLREGDVDKSVKIATDVLTRDPGNKEALGILSDAERRKAPASPAPAPPAQKGPGLAEQAQAMAYYNRGLVAYAGDQPESAAKEWERALELDPGNLKARRALQRVRNDIAGSPAP